MRKKRSLLLLALFLIALLGSCAKAVDPSSSTSRPMDSPTTKASLPNPSTNSSAGTSTSVSLSGPTGSLTTRNTTQSANTTARTTKSTTRRTTGTPADDARQVYFGAYHVDPLMRNDVFEELLDSNYVNCFFLTRGYYNRHQIAEGAQKVKAHQKKAWLMISEAIFNFYEDRTERIDNWKSQVEEIVNLIKQEDAFDAVLGFYFDEPYLWRIKPEWLREVSFYLQTQYNKRVFVCFSVGEVAPRIWNDPSRIQQQIDAYYGQYITDVAYDMYMGYDYSLYKSVADEMKRRMGNRADLKIWYIPCTMDYLGDKQEGYAIEHLNGMYSLLKEESNPGGLMCYTYHTYSTAEEPLGNVGLDHLLDPGYKKYWPRLGSRIQEIGREIINKT